MQNSPAIHKYSNPLLIPGMKLKKLKNDIENRRVQLASMTEENIQLKNRLAEILRDRFDKNLLEAIDSFHSSFINKDEMISLLRHEVVEMNKLLAKDIFEDRKIQQRLRKLRNNIITAQTQFRKLKADFNDFLAENIL